MASQRPQTILHAHSVTPNNQFQPCYGVVGAAHVRHFIVHTRRAGHVVTPPLNCGVMRQGHVIYE
jgi:hypothetical protein